MNRQMADFLALEAAKEPFHHIHGAGKDGYPVLLKLLQERGGPGGPPGAAGAGVHL